MNVEELKRREKILKDLETSIIKRAGKKKKAVFDRFPLLFTFLGAFGLVATYYGFERIIDRYQIFSDNPYLLLGVGVITLVLTGTLYSRLK